MQYYKVTYFVQDFFQRHLTNEIFSDLFVAVIDYKVVPFTFVFSPSGPRKQWLILRNSLLKVSRGCGKSSSELSRSETLVISKLGNFLPT